MTETTPDPVTRIRAVREHITAETAKLPAVDENGHPIISDPPPAA